MPNRIPEGGTPTIATGEDSNRDSRAEGTETLKTNHLSSDSSVGLQSQNKDTQNEGDSVESLKKQLEDQKLELSRQKSEAANLSRVTYENLKDECSRNPAKIADIANHDPKTADKIVKSIYGEQGIYNVQQLVEYAKSEDKFKDVKDETILSLREELNEVKKASRIKEEKSEKAETKIFYDKLYQKYPSLAKSNDPDNVNYNQWRKSYMDLNSNIDPLERMEKAYNMAFPDGSEMDSRKFERGYSSIPSGSGSSRKGGGKLMSEDAEIVLKNMGL